MDKLKVLLADDEIKIREGFKRLFDWEQHGCEVTGEAADGMEALNKIEDLRPDIVIMDINIPVMTGLKVIELSRIKYPSTAFIIVSGYDDFSYCRKALQLKITDYILKPVNFEEFGSNIDRLKTAIFESEIREQAGSEKQETKAIVNIIKYLEKHLSEDISLNILAEEFHFSPQYVSQLFKSEIGVNFLSYLTNMRLEKAKGLLASSSCVPIAEIAMRVGYGDYRVFTKSFKKVEGLTPSQYRRQFIGELKNG